MALTFKLILNRVRYGRRVQYGDFAPWEMEEDDPGQEEFKPVPDPRWGRLKNEMSIPKEQRSPTYLMEKYLPEKYGVNQSQVIDIAKRYIDSTKNHHDFHDYLSNYNPSLLSILPTRGSSASEIIRKMRRNSLDDSSVHRYVSSYLFDTNKSQEAYEHMSHGAKMFKLTGKI